MLESKPVTPAQPNEARYPIDRLNLFQRHNRDTFQKAFGQQAPPWDRAKPIKRWFDTGALEGSEDPQNDVVTYEGYDTGQKKWRRIALTVADASSINLPGAFVYPKRIVAPTPAVLVDPNGAHPLNVNYLCTREEAQRLCDELQAEGIQESAAFTGPLQINWLGEQRRQWCVVWHGELRSAPQLLMYQTANGVGAPGKWDTSSGSPIWISYMQDTGEQDVRPEVLMPTRKLLANERIDVGLFGIAVVRTDKTQDQAAPGTGSLTQDQDKLLRAAAAGVAVLVEALPALVPVS